MDLRLGFFTGAVHDWNAQQTADAVAETGFAGIEWEMRAGEGHIRRDAAATDAEDRRRQSDALGLEVCCISAHPSAELLDPRTIPALVEAAQATGAHLIRAFAPPFDPSRPVDDQLGEVRKILARHADGYDDAGVTLVIELSEETILPSPELIRRVCQGLDSSAVGALYDPGNMLNEGNLAPPFALAVLGDLLHHVHLKNEAFVRTDGRWVPEIVRADEGLVDWQHVFEELRRVEYAGWVVIDHLSAEPSTDRMILERQVVERLWAGQAE
jgi:sugar phosphate isomerase/epimerase